jgi:glutaredoxin
METELTERKTKLQDEVKHLKDDIVTLKSIVADSLVEELYKVKENKDPNVCVVYTFTKGIYDVYIKIFPNLGEIRTVFKIWNKPIMTSKSHGYTSCLYDYDDTNIIGNHSLKEFVLRFCLDNIFEYCICESCLRPYNFHINYLSTDNICDFCIFIKEKMERSVQYDLLNYKDSRLSYTPLMIAKKLIYIEDEYKDMSNITHYMCWLKTVNNITLQLFKNEKNKICLTADSDHFNHEYYYIDLEKDFTLENLKEAVKEVYEKYTVCDICNEIELFLGGKIHPEEGNERLCFSCYIDLQNRVKSKEETDVE